MTVLIATEEDGSQWVTLEDYESMRKIALESRVIIEQFQKLLDVYTTTDAFIKLAELQTRSAEQRNEAVADGSGIIPASEDDTDEPCPICNGKKIAVDADLVWRKCRTCKGTGKVSTNK